MKLYIVRCKKTGKFIAPVIAGKSTTSQGLSDIPRTFTKLTAAESAARWWAAGHAGKDWYDGDPHERTWPVKGRDVSTLRVHKIYFALRTLGDKIRPTGAST